MCWKVFSSFAFAGIRIRTAWIVRSHRSNMHKDTNSSISPYNFGMVLKETMLNLGPTFIKGEQYDAVENFHLTIHFFAMVFIVAAFIFVASIIFELSVWAFYSLLQSQDHKYGSYMPLLTDAVGQSLSTRPDIIGPEISKVR